MKSNCGAHFFEKKNPTYHRPYMKKTRSGTLLMLLYIIKNVLIVLLFLVGESQNEATFDKVVVAVWKHILFIK